VNEQELADGVERVHDHLAATQERPVERTASRWIGEAEAVAADLVHGDVTRAVVRKRLGHVQELLANVSTTADETADEHVVEAKRLVDELLDELES
jgi:hypothetical protein